MSLMKKIEHPFLKLSKKSFQNGTLSKIFPPKLRLPKQAFPPRFWVEEKDFFCGGYFVCYERKISIDQVVKTCQARNWQFLANLMGDFLIIFCDYSSRELFVLTDQTGKFPWYFAITDEEMISSTSFGLVKDSLKSLTLDVDAAFDFLTANYVLLMDKRTILSEIKQVPLATLLRVDRNLTYSLTPLVNIDTFFAEKPIPYGSEKEFADDLVSFLGQLVAERLKALGNLRFAADLSSGFDSPLVCYLLKQLSPRLFFCYSCVSPYIVKDTDPQIVRKFAQKHNLEVEFIPVDNFFPFSDFDLAWISRNFYPGSFGVEWVWTENQAAKKKGAKAIFQGYGGDEMYASFSMETWVRFPAQYAYFLSAVNAVKHWHIERLLTKQGIKMFLDRNRFSQKKFYPILIPPTSALGLLDYFSLWWETEVWPITPFLDWRLLQFARRIPHQDKKVPDKRRVWEHRKDIFVSSQFRPKGEGPEILFRRFITERRDFVISVLENSLLAKKGWVRAQEIVRDLLKGNDKQYLDGVASSYFHQLVRLEYFLQKNKVKVPTSW